MGDGGTVRDVALQGMSQTWERGTERDVWGGSAAPGTIKEPPPPSQHVRQRRACASARLIIQGKIELWYSKHSTPFFSRCMRWRVHRKKVRESGETEAGRVRHHRGKAGVGTPSTPRRPPRAAFGMGKGMRACTFGGRHPPRLRSSARTQTETVVAACRGERREGRACPEACPGAELPLCEEGAS